jgi:hypothetical protein
MATGFELSVSEILLLADRGAEVFALSIGIRVCVLLHDPGKFRHIKPGEVHGDWQTRRRGLIA